MVASPPLSIESLAQQLGEHKGVLWAVESCKMVQSKQSPADLVASNAAEAWVKDPGPATQAAALAAAKKTDYQGPGAWAAQAAAWASPATKASAPAAAGGAPAASAAAPVGAVAGGAMSAGAGVGVAAATSGGGHKGATAVQASLVSVAVAGAVGIAAALAAGVKPPSAAMPAGAPPAPGQPPAPGAAPPKLSAPAVPGAPPLPSPSDLAKIQKIQKPFIELGENILLHKSPL